MPAFRSRKALDTFLAAAILVAGAAVPSNAGAQEWPSRAVRIVLPLAAGSGADIVARLIAERLAKAWGQGVTVENRPGGDAVVAINTVLGANDSHMLLWGPSAAFAAHPYTHAKIPYDVRALVPVVRVSDTLISMTVANSAKATTIDELVRLARMQPGRLGWASVGGLNDLLFQAFVKTAAIDMPRVSYRDAAQAANDLADGRVQAYTSSYAIARPHVEAGRIRPIAFTNSARAAIMPGIPTVREAGHPTLELDGIVGAYATSAVPLAARQRISSDVRAALADKSVLDRLTATGQVASPADSAPFAAAIESQRKSAAAAAQVLGIKAAE